MQASKKRRSSAVNKRAYAHYVLRELRSATKDFKQPMAFLLKQQYPHNRFIILIGCLASLRTRDTTALVVCQKLFSYVQSPEQLVNFPLQQLRAILYPLGFYRKKAALFIAVSQELIDRFGGEVPCDEEDLLSIAGVGRKTANLIVSVACNKPAICVDTHVHRLANAFRLVQTTTPEQTEYALARLYPRCVWKEINRVFVSFGQQYSRAEQKKRIELLYKNYKGTD
jgi:endonuclease III